MYQYKAKVLSIYDGDTITVLIQLGFDISFQAKLRLYGINTPEIRTRNKEEKLKGIEARNFLAELIENKEVIIETTKQEKYGRYLATIFLGRINVNKLLIKKGFAKEYYGEKRN